MHIGVLLVSREQMFDKPPFSQKYEKLIVDLHLIICYIEIGWVSFMLKVLGLCDLLIGVSYTISHLSFQL